MTRAKPSTMNEMNSDKKRHDVRSVQQIDLLIVRFVIQVNSTPKQVKQTRIIVTDTTMFDPFDRSMKLTSPESSLSTLRFSKISILDTMTPRRAIADMARNRIRLEKQRHREQALIDF